MPEPRTEKPRKSSSWQATDATDADHQGRLVVADMAHSFVREEEETGTVGKEILFVPDFDAQSVQEAVRSCIRKGKWCSELGRCIRSSQTGEEVLSFLQFS
jgi:hypothetical protein